MTRKQNLTIVAGVVILVALGVLGFRFSPLSSVSYYQGIHPSFAAIYYNGDYYTTAEPLDATTARIGSATFNFDPDEPRANMPNLQGELTDVHVIRDLAGYVPGETYTHIMSTVGGTPQINEPYKRYTWEIPQADGATKFYTMDLWLCSLDVNVFVKPDTYWAPLFGEQVNQRYKDTEIWLKLETSNEWGNYFTDPEIQKTYFGLGYLELADFEEFGDDPKLDFLPKSRWVALDLYTDPEGLPESVKTPQNLADDLYGSEINPTFFRNEYFTKLTASSFGTYGYNALDGSFRSDSVQARILAHVFVVGEWTVKPDLDRDPDIHDPSEYEGIITRIVNKLDDLMSSPLGRVQLYLAFLILVVALVFVMNPRLVFDWAREFQRAGET